MIKTNSINVNYCPLHLPSTSVNDWQNLPDEPGVYLFTIGSSVLYVGKALSLRNRHRCKGSHDVYAKMTSISYDASNLLRIRWMSFADAPILQNCLDQTLLGYEEHLIKTYRPTWNNRLNGVSIDPDYLYKIDQLFFLTMTNNLTFSTEPFNTISMSDMSDKLTADGQAHAKRRMSSFQFNSNEWTFKDSEVVKKKVCNIASLSSGWVNPEHVILKALDAYSHLLKSNGVPTLMDGVEDTDLNEFMPKIISNKDMQEAARLMLKCNPSMTLDSLILRCTERSAQDISPSEFMFIKAVHDTHTGIDTLDVQITQDDSIAA